MQLREFEEMAKKEQDRSKAERERLQRELVRAQEQQKKASLRAKFRSSVNITMVAEQFKTSV